MQKLWIPGSFFFSPPKSLGARLMSTHPSYLCVFFPDKLSYLVLIGKNTSGLELWMKEPLHWLI